MHYMNLVLQEIEQYIMKDIIIILIIIIITKYIDIINKLHFWGLFFVFFINLLYICKKNMEEKEAEKMATAISGAFLFPAADARRELGIRRSAVTKDMNITCREYGISMFLLVKRANLCGIISDSTAKDFYIKASQAGWKKNEPARIEKEQPMLFAQLVFRAVSEKEISVQKGAELLKKPYQFVMENCFAEEG